MISKSVWESSSSSAPSYWRPAQQALGGPKGAALYLPPYSQFTFDNKGTTVKLINLSLKEGLYYDNQGQRLGSVPDDWRNY